MYVAGFAPAAGDPIEIPGASHAVPVAHPGATAHLILQAASLPVAA